MLQNEIIVKNLSTNQAVFSDQNGFYELQIASNKSTLIQYSFIGYDTLIIRINPQPSEKIVKRDIVIQEGSRQIGVVGVTAKKIDIGLKTIRPEHTTILLDVSGNAVENMVKTMMGVSSNNELSSQYNVRGGNFDENLIYINDIQIYRPFLVRSGQQEGLSFINPNLVKTIDFSAGGFSSKYGDKMSSVLDISYKKPKKFAASVSGSILGGTAHIEGRSKNKKISYIAGVRYKQSSYLLDSMEVKGDYKPIFADFQTFITYKLTPKIHFEILGNVAQNRYIFTPSESNQTFGTFTEAYALKILYEGQEEDRYSSFFGAFSTKYQPTKDLILKFTASSFYTVEQEFYDIHGYYALNQLDNDLSSDNFGDSIQNLGSGEYLQHARNNLNATIINYAHNGYLNKKQNYIEWGAKYQQEFIDDKISEWDMIDSTGYSINQDYNYPTDVVVLDRAVRAKNSMQTNRFSAFLQNTYTFRYIDLKLTGGLRASYWDYNKDVLISPRFSVQFKPDWVSEIRFRFATGIYYQSPFYREIRDFEGSLVEDSKAQRSIHFIVGTYYDLQIWSRPFQFSGEIYYKKLDNLIPYELDNVRINYYAHQRAKGYAVGFDSKIYGEFVPGVDSWITFSVMGTRENIDNDNYYIYYNQDTIQVYNRTDAIDSIFVEPGFIPRPADQLISVGMFFQDYMPGNKNIKASLGFYFGTGVPYGPPQTDRWRVGNNRSFPVYMRADFGISILLKSEKKKYKYTFFNSFKSVWFNFEAFNILDIQNTVNYSWVRIVPNSTNPIPFRYNMIPVANHLTGRLLNLKLTCNF